MVCEAEESGLRIVKGVLVMHSNVIFPSFVSADSDTLLRQTHILLNVPDLKDPIRIQGINSATCLITNHVNYIVVLKRRSSTEIYWR